MSSRRLPREGEGSAQAGGSRREAWQLWKARLEQLPDGSWLNPAGIDDESFFRSLEAVRSERWGTDDGAAGD